jgi:glucose-1-phosphate thymidylyltransferase
MRILTFPLPLRLEMWGVIPAAGRGSRIQPLAFSKELLPVGSRTEEGVERPCAVSEYLVERLILGGADKICFVISPGKSDILGYYGDCYGGAQIAYVVQPNAEGLCDAIFRASCVVGNAESVLVGLPDTIWFPEDALNALPDAPLSFLLFPVEHPEFFDAVVLEGDEVREIQVKQRFPASHWVWGAFRLSASGFRELKTLWETRERRDEYFGTLVNSYLGSGGAAIGVKAGEAYVDVGTLHGYRTAMTLLLSRQDLRTSRMVRTRPQTSVLAEAVTSNGAGT